MEIKNIKINEKSNEKKLKLKREMNKCRNIIITDSMIEVSLIGAILYTYPNPRFSTMLIMGALALAGTGVYEIENRINEYKNLNKDYKKLVKNIEE